MVSVKNKGCNVLNNLKSLTALKNQRKKEEKAFEHLKKVYLNLEGYSDAQILEFFGLQKREEIIGYRVMVESTALKEGEGQLEEGLCLCQDSKGHSKLLYASHKEAEAQCTVLQHTQNIKLKIYVCPIAKGWHLSKI